MACEPKVDYDVFEEAQREIVRVPVGWRAPRNSVVFQVNHRNILAFVPLAGQPVFGGESETWTIERVPANGVTHMFARGRHIYGCDSVYLGRLEGLRRTDHLLELLSRLLVSFTAQCQGHGNYIHHEERKLNERDDGVIGVEDIYGLKPGPHTLYVYKTMKSHWSSVALDINTGYALDVDNIDAAIHEILQDYANGL